MGNQNKPRDEGWLRRTLNDILARLRALETAPRTRHAGVSGGTLRVTNGGKIVVGDSSGYTITIDPDPSGGRPRVAIDMGTAGVAELGATELGGETLAELRVTATDGAIGLAGVSAQRAGFWIYPDGGSGDYATSAQIQPDIAQLLYQDSGGTLRSACRVDEQGAGNFTYDDAGNIVSGIWADPDGNVYHRGSLETG